VGDVGLRFGCVSRRYAYISRGGVGRVNKFGAFRRNSTDSVWAEFTVHKFKKFQKNKKIRKNYVKKLDEILRLLVKIFFQIGIVWLVKI
jgi:type I site-specific restriction endonuclease